MNERIKELAEQARGTKKHVPPVWQFYDIELEKFAELIIRECAEIGYNAYWNDPEEVRGMHIKEQIKNHFGVE